MPDERHTFETARVRLEEIAAEVRKKDTSLEKSLDLLEEGVRLANICTELVDHTDLSATITQTVPETSAGSPGDDEAPSDDVQPDVRADDDTVAGPDQLSAADSDATSVGSEVTGPDVDEVVMESDEGPDFDGVDEDLHEPGGPHEGE